MKTGFKIALALAAVGGAFFLINKKDYAKLFYNQQWTVTRDSRGNNANIPLNDLSSYRVTEDGLTASASGATGRFDDDKTILWSNGSIWKVL